jgi:ABC-type antimicrobial peptide transport system permease subunit
MMLAVRATGDPARLARSLRALVAEWDREAPVYDLRTMEERLSGSIAYRRRVTVLLGGFAALALVLTVAGIYSVMSYLVARRTREIAIRLAVGATRGDVLRMVVARAAALAGAGVFLGVMGALAVTRVLSNLLYGIDPSDPATLAAVSLALTLVALAAAYLPARRAAAMDPMAAMRAE